MTVTSADPRDLLIQQVVVGRTFAELGGVWQIVNEKVSVAKRAGARSVTMIDAIPKTHPMWQGFEQHVRSQGVHDLRGYAPVNLDTVEASEVGGPYDVLHCSGVLYHCPNPLHSLCKMASLANEFVIVTSMVVEPVIASAAGRIDLPEGAALLVAALGEEQFRVVDAYWRERGISSIVLLQEGERRLDWDVRDYGPWWWLYTPATMEGMIRAAGMEPLEGVTWWGGRTHTVLARVVKRMGMEPFRLGTFLQQGQNPHAN
jgi:hypothetical protein